MLGKTNGLENDLVILSEAANYDPTKAILLKAFAAAKLPLPSPDQGPLLARNSVRVGILHSLSGTMAISETSLRDALLFAVDEINRAGGVSIDDKRFVVEPFVVDCRPSE